MKKLIIFLALAFLLVLPMLNAMEYIDTYSPYTKTTCEDKIGNRTCSATLYSAPEFVYEDTEWKNIKDAKSLKNTGLIIETYLEEDPNYPVTIVDYNADTLIADVGKFTLYEDVPLRRWSYNETKLKLFLEECENSKNPQGKYTGKCNALNQGKGNKEGILKQIYKETYDKYSDEMVNINFLDLGSKRVSIPLTMGDIIEFGPNSTAIVLDYTYDKGDTYVEQASPNYNAGGQSQFTIRQSGTNEIISYIKWDIRSLLSKNLLSANMSLWIYENQLDSGDALNVTFTYMNNQTWDENVVTYNLQPTGTAIYENYAIVSYGEVSQHYNYTITELLDTSISNLLNNTTIKINAIPYSGNTAADFIRFHSKEAAISSRRPILYVTYEDIAVGVTLNSPANNSQFLPNENIQLNCTADLRAGPDTSNITNMTLYIDGVANVTTGSAFWDTTGLRARWAMDYNSTASYNNVFNLTAYNMLTNGGPTENGKILGAYMFDGNNDLMNTTNTTNQIVGTNTTWTISAWLKTIEDADGNFHIPLRLSVNTTTTNGGAALFIQQTSTNGINLAIKNSTGTNEFYALTSLINTNEWYFVTATYDNGNFTGYLNGDMVVNLPSQTFIGFGNAPVVLGSMSTNNYFNGTIDEVRIYNRTLSGEEVSDLYYFQGPDYSVNTITKNISFPTISTHNWTCDAWNSTTLFTTGTNKVNIAGLSIDDVYYVNSTISGALENFSIALSLNSTKITGVSANLIYNGTTYTASTNDVGDNRLYTYMLNIPGVTTTSNKSFFWNITYTSESITYSTESETYYQTVSPFSIGNCTGSNNQTILSLIMKDEQSLTSMNGTIEITAYIYSFGTKDVVAIYNDTRTYNGTPVTVCLANMTGDYSTDYQIKHYGNSSYFKRFVSVQNFTLNNQTLGQNITLYGLLQSSGNAFSIVVRGSPVGNNNLIVDVQKQYLGLNTFLSVESPTTDNDGLTIGNLIQNNEVYNFVVSREGVVIGTFNNYIVKCANVITGDCQVQLNPGQTTASIEDFTNYGNISGVYLLDNTEKKLYFTFSSTDGNAHNVRTYIAKDDGYGNTTICNQSTYGTSGTLICNVPPLFQNNSFSGQVYSDNVYVGFQLFFMGDNPSWGGVDIILQIMLFSSLVLLMMSSPVLTIIGAMLGMLLSALIFILGTGNIWDGISIIAFFIAAGIILIMKMRRAYG